jgi:signal transduction histidine kinase
MTPVPTAMPPAARSLSARLLILTALFVMLAEVLIYLPSVSRFRVVWLEERLSAAHLALLAVDATPDAMVSEELKRELLGHVGARAVALKREGRRMLMLSEEMPPAVDRQVELGQDGPAMLIADALMTMTRERSGLMRVVGLSPRDATTLVEALLEEAPLRTAMLDYSARILTLSVAISLITGALVYVSLLMGIVRPMRRLTESMIGFRLAPEDQTRALAPGARGDEIGIAERELGRMQTELRAALHQKTRLAAVGIAVAKIGHDLGNILATAQLVSDRLAESADPEVKRVAPRLIGAVDRAIQLTEATLRYGSEGEIRLARAPVGLRALIEELRAALAPPSGEALRWLNEVPEDAVVAADRAQLFRALFNIANNAIQAMGQGGELRFALRSDEGGVALEIADTGPGIPAARRQDLFKPFGGTGRAGGHGLGLAIAQDIARAHGGTVMLVRTGAGGSVFRLSLPF